MSWTPSWSKNGRTWLPSSFSCSPRPMSGRPGALTRPWATSTRKPSTPRSSQKRRIERNSSWTAGWSQLKSGCSGAKRWRYHSPSGTRVQAGPPKRDSQSLGGSSPFWPRPLRKWKRSRRAEPGPSASAAAEPFVLVGAVVGDEVDDDPQAQPVGLADHGLGVVQGAEHRVDGAVVGDVVAGVGLRGGVEGAEPDGVDAQVAQVRQPAADAGQVPHAVAVAVGEAARIDLVDHRVAPPPGGGRGGGAASAGSCRP